MHVDYRFVERRSSRCMTWTVVELDAQDEGVRMASPPNLALGHGLAPLSSCSSRKRGRSRVVKRLEYLSPLFCFSVPAEHGSVSFTP